MRSAHHPFPLTKLRGLPPGLRVALKRRGIATVERLLERAGERAARERLAAAVQIEPELLEAIVRRADLARVNGIGSVFGDMMEAVGVTDVTILRRQHAEDLHARLKRFNDEHRLARRAPTLEEVTDWITQAQALPDKLSD